jgi:hypothetical protein
MPSCAASNPSHDFMLVDPLCCNDDRAGEIGPTFHFMIRHDLVLANDSYTVFNVEQIEGLPEIYYAKATPTPSRRHLLASPPRLLQHFLW